jgi:hypothetical protein
LEKDGVFLNGNGVFSFTADALINPDIKKIDNNIDVKGEGIEYVIADYKTPNIKDGWKEAEVVIDLRSAYRENNKYSFLISVPDLKNDDGVDDGIILDEMRVDLFGSWLMTRIKNVWKKL